LSFPGRGRGWHHLPRRDRPKNGRRSMYEPTGKRFDRGTGTRGRLVVHGDYAGQRKQNGTVSSGQAGKGGLPIATRSATPPTRGREGKGFGNRPAGNRAEGSFVGTGFFRATYSSAGTSTVSGYEGTLGRGSSLAYRRGARAVGGFRKYKDASIQRPYADARKGLAWGGKQKGTRGRPERAYDWGEGYRPLLRIDKIVRGETVARRLWRRGARGS